MNAHTPLRGQHLRKPVRRGLPGSALLLRMISPGFARILDRIDAGLDSGTLEVTTPDGSIRILGSRGPGLTALVELKSWTALLRLATGGSVGWYQAWEAGEWESSDMVPIFDLFIRNRAGLRNTARASGLARWSAKWRHRLRRNDKAMARRNIAHHYDLGNDFYALWLDETMSYSSAIFDSENITLAEAQRVKVAAIAQRVGAEPGQSLLEIGCGWGYLSGTLTNEYGADVTAISLSQEQTAWAQAHHSGPDFRICDYRDMAGQFDAIVSVEMVEAVGREYWPDFLDCIVRNLKPGGRAALQYIAIADDIFDAYAGGADFIQSYIFPGGMLLSQSRFRALAEDRGLVWQDQIDFGLDYARTLKEWRERFDAAVDAGKLPVGFDEHFVRLWRYYLMYCEGGFGGGGITVSQVTLVKG